MFTILDTVNRGLCIGCGACAVATGLPGLIRLDDDGMCVADLGSLPHELLPRADVVCPFSDRALDEDEVSSRVHRGELVGHELLGRFTGTYIGRVDDTLYLEGSSSGGMTSWMLSELVKRGVVDAVVNVGRTDPESGAIFSYGASDLTEIKQRRKSDYYSVTLAEAFNQVRSDDRRFALVGVPCFIKAARLLAEEDPVLKERLVFFVGLVCGHMKSRYFGESMAWQLGIAPGDVAAVDFRVKNKDRAASDYDFGAQSRAEGEWRYRRTRDLIGGNWGYAAFQPEACNFCDDIFAETADVAFGDAWLPEHQSDWRGTNVVVSRSPLADEIIRRGIESGELEAAAADPDQVARSQAGNFRHRRLGLAVRLADDEARGLPIPKKRVEPGLGGVSERRLKIIRKRRELSRLSFSTYRAAKAAGDLSIYLNAMAEGIREYKRIETPLWQRLARKARSEVRRLLRR